MGQHKVKRKQNSDNFFKACKKQEHDPIEFNILVAKNDWAALGFTSPTYTCYTKSGDTYEMNHITVDHRLSANNKLLDFMYAKKKAIEITPPETPNQAFTFAYSVASLQAPAAAAKKLELSHGTENEPITTTATHV